MIHRTKYIDLIYQEDASDYLIVSFNPMNIRSDGKRFWGDAFFRKNKVSALGIVSTSPNWFPRVAMEEILEVARPILSRYRHICTYGASMGAYGAIKYSQLLGAHTAVSFSPQHTIDPRYEHSRPQFSVHFDEELHHDMLIQAKDLGGRIFLFYDPYYRPDSCAADYIAGQGAIDRVAIPFVGHTTIQLFERENRGMNVLQYCMARNLPELRQFTRKARTISTLRPPNVARALVARHMHRALKVCERYPDALEGKWSDHFCRAVKQHGTVDLAIEWARRMTANNPQCPKGFRNLANFLSIKGDFAGAQAAIEQALLLDPKNYRYMIDAGLIAKEGGQFEEVIFWFSKAMETFPKDPLTFMITAAFFEERQLADRALAILREAQVHHPQNSPIMDMIRKIETGMGAPER